MHRNTPATLESPLVLRFLDGEERAALQRKAVTRACEPGAVLVPAGEPWPYLLEVLRGEVHVCKLSADGRCLVPRMLGPGEFFWGRPLFGDETMPVYLEAKAPSEVRLWAYRDLLPAVRRNPQALWDLCHTLSEQMMRAADYIESMAFQPLSARLARLLLDEYAHREGAWQGRSLSLERMAAHLGSSREVVCRVLHGLEDTGLLSLTRTELVIKDLSGLQEAAGGGGGGSGGAIAAQVPSGGC